MAPVFYAIPSKKPAADAQLCIDAWRDMGYYVAIWRDHGDDEVDCDLLLRGAYEGYPRATNSLCFEILATKQNVQWIVAGGDDIWPDPKKRAGVIGEECLAYFEQHHASRGSDLDANLARTFGVMQPTGDRWGAARHMPNVAGSAYADRVCGSPWMGEQFIRRINGGAGPFWEGYVHMFPDEEMQEVCQALGILWQRQDVTQEHKHWGREHRRIPPYLMEANSRAHWDKYKKLFDGRKGAGFPGHEPLPVDTHAQHE